MAGRSEELNTKLTATDDASKVIDKVADKLDDLEATDAESTVSAEDDASKTIAKVAGELDQIDKTEAEATITAEDDTAKTISKIDARLKDLTDEDRTAILKADAAQAQREVDQLTRKLADAKSYDDETIAMFVEARGNAQQRIDAIQAELRAIDSTSVEAEVTADTSRAEGAIDGLIGKLGDVDGPIGDIGSKLGDIASPGGVVAALGAGLFAAGDHAANLAVEADNLAKLTGDSVEEASRLNAVWKSSGAEASDLQDVLLQMAGVLADDADLAAQLGINLADGRSMGDRFVEVVGKVGDKFDDAGERSLIMSKLFGEEGVRQVNTVINSVGDLDTALENVSGASVFDSQDVAAAREWQATMTELKTSLMGFATVIGQQVVPLLSSLSAGAGDVRTGFEWLPGPIQDTLGKLALYPRVMGESIEAQVKFPVTAAKTIGGWLGIGDSAEKAGLGTRIAAQALRDALKAANEAEGGVDAWIKTSLESALAQAKAKAATDAVTKATEAEVDAIGDYVDAQLEALEATKRQTEARRAAADAAFAVRRAEVSFAEAVWNTTVAQNDSTLSLEAKQIALDDTVTAADALAAEEQRLAEQTAASRGETLTAEQSQRAWAESMLASAGSLQGPMRQALLDYVAQVTGIPVEKVTTVFANTDEASVTEAEGILEQLARQRIATVQVRLAGGRLTNDGTIDFGGGVTAQSAERVDRRVTRDGVVGAAMVAISDAQMDRFAQIVAQAVVDAANASTNNALNRVATHLRMGRR